MCGLIAQNNPVNLVREIAAVPLPLPFLSWIADDALNLAVFEKRPFALETISKDPIDVVLTTTGLDELATGRDEPAPDVLILDMLADRDIDCLESTMELSRSCSWRWPWKTSGAGAENLVGIPERDDDLRVGGALLRTWAGDDGRAEGAKCEESSRRPQVD